MSDFVNKTGIVPEPLGNTVRGNDTVFEGEQYTVTLEKINAAIIGYLKDSIVPSVNDNGEVRNVPVLYADGERWAQIRKEGYLRDEKNDKLLAPLIVIRRTNVTPGELNNPNNKYMYSTMDAGWNRRNVYDRFAVINKIRPSSAIRNVMIPDYVDIEYELVMWAEYQEHMDRLIEQINVENFEYWGSRNSYKFRVSIDSFQGQSELPATSDRVVRVQLTIKVGAYLLPESAVKNFKLAPTSRTAYTTKKVVVKETVVNHIET